MTGNTIELKNNVTILKRLRKLDIFEQIILLVFYLWFLLRLWPGSFSNANLCLSFLLVSETFVVILLLVRRPAENISTSFMDWFIAIAGSLLPLLVNKGGEFLLPRVGLFLLFFGVFVHTAAKLCLLRSFGMVPANRGVKVNGLYSVVRHPMYAGYFLTHLGFFIAAPSLRNIIVYIGTWGFLLSRIFLEEKLLSRSPDYQEYQKRVPYRIIPKVF